MREESGSHTPEGRDRALLDLQVYLCMELLCEMSFLAGCGQKGLKAMALNTCMLVMPTLICSQ